MDEKEEPSLEVKEKKEELKTEAQKRIEELEAEIQRQGSNCSFFFLSNFFD